MKKLLLLFVLAVYSNFCGAQNYQCLQNGVKHYFINSQNYLRGISIDSVHTHGDTTIYYPYQVFRGYGGSYSDVDTIIGGWLGKKVTQLPDGTFLFDNTWGDTVTVKTQAALGDSWLFYSDTTYHAYLATLTAFDTMTILDTLDSVKVITIKSYHGGQNIVYDPLNGYQLILSKNHGFAQAFDLYTFPYYSHSDDYFEDRYTEVGGSTPFNIVDYHDPTSLEMYGSLNVGDMFAGYYGDQTFCGYGQASDYTHYDSVVAKIVIDPTHINFIIHRIMNGTTYYGYYGGGSSSDNFTGSVYDTLQADTTHIFLSRMPEKSTYPESTPFAYFYYPADSSFCYTSPMYKYTSPWIFEGCPQEVHFKQGLPPIYNVTCPNVPCGEYIGYDVIATDAIFYALINHHSCNDSILPPLSIKTSLTTDDLNIFPNPAENELNISAPRDIHRVVVYNMLGQTVYSQQFNSEKVQLNVSGLASGMYFLKVNGEVVQKFVKR